MPNFPEGARVLVGASEGEQVEGEVVGHDQHVVLVRIPDVCDAGRFNPKYVRLVDESGAGPEGKGPANAP